MHDAGVNKLQRAIAATTLLTLCMAISSPSQAEQTPPPHVPEPESASSAAPDLASAPDAVPSGASVRPATLYGASAPAGVAYGAPGGMPYYAAGTPGIDPSIIEESLRLRLDQVETERKQLIHAGRPPYFRTRRAVGFTALGAGAGILAATLMGFLLRQMYASHGGAPADDLRFTFAERVLYPVGTLLGAGLMGVGIWGLTSAKGDDPYREQIAALTQEYQRLRKEHKRARHDRKRFEKYGVSGELSLEQQAPRFSLRLQVRL